MNKETETETETLTDDMLRLLREEAGYSGDAVQMIICNMALSREEEEWDNEEAWEDRFGGGGFNEYEKQALLSCGTVAKARKECARVISHMREMDESISHARVIA